MKHVHTGFPMHGPLAQPISVPRTLSTLRLRLSDGAATSIYVARFPRNSVRLQIKLLPGSQSLRTWCNLEGVSDAIVAGFFTRPAVTPLGELRIAGQRVPSTPFDSPWDAMRSCVHIDGDTVRIGPRETIEAEPRGDLLQAGPLLVRSGNSLIKRGTDPEGFSAGSRQFDSDITRGRYPRSALAVRDGEVLAVVCDGRASTEAGLTLAELADALVELGVEEAINLDGGGSASIVVGGRLRNHPREEHGVPIPAGRPIATAIVFMPS